MPARTSCLSICLASQPSASAHTLLTTASDVTDQLQLIGRVGSGLRGGDLGSSSVRDQVLVPLPFHKLFYIAISKPYFSSP